MTAVPVSGDGLRLSGYAFEVVAVLLGGMMALVLLLVGCNVRRLRITCSGVLCIFIGAGAPRLPSPSATRRTSTPLTPELTTRELTTRACAHR